MSPNSCHIIARFGDLRGSISGAFSSLFRGYWGLLVVLLLATPQAMILLQSRVAPAAHALMLVGISALSLRIGVAAARWREAVVRDVKFRIGRDGISAAYSDGHAKLACRCGNSLSFARDRSGPAMAMRACLADATVIGFGLTAINLMLYVGLLAFLGVQSSLVMAVLGLSVACLVLGIARGTGIARSESVLRIRLNRGLCLQCGYRLQSDPIDRRFREHLCPECGRPYLTGSDHSNRVIEDQAQA
jgi:hypothetical protein